MSHVNDVQVIPENEPIEVAVGETVTYRYDIEASTAAGFFNPDYCLSPELVDGISVDIQLKVNGAIQKSETACLSTLPAQDPTPHDFNYQFTGSSEGAVTFTIDVYGSETTTHLGHREVQVDVTGTNGGDDGSGGGDVSDPGGGDDGGSGDDSSAVDRLLSTLGFNPDELTGQVKIALAGLIILASVYVLGTLFDVQVPVGGGS